MPLWLAAQDADADYRVGRVTWRVNTVGVFAVDKFTIQDAILVSVIKLPVFQVDGADEPPDSPPEPEGPSVILLRPLRPNSSGCPC